MEDIYQDNYAQKCLCKYLGVWGLMLVVVRSAGQSNISADELVSKLEDGSQKWSKSSLQVLHRLWSEHGAAVHAQQELQASLRIGQVRFQSLRWAGPSVWRVRVWGFCVRRRWWTCSGGWGWRWAPTFVDLSILRTSRCCWRSLSPLDWCVRSPSRWAFHSFRWDFTDGCPSFDLKWPHLWPFYPCRTSTSSSRRWQLWWRLYEDEQPGTNTKWPQIIVCYYRKCLSLK